MKLQQVQCQSVTVLLLLLMMIVMTVDSFALLSKKRIYQSYDHYKTHIALFVCYFEYNSLNW
jgi:hypothetical protein